MKKIIILSVVCFLVSCSKENECVNAWDSYTKEESRLLSKYGWGNVPFDSVKLIRKNYQFQYPSCQFEW